MFPNDPNEWSDGDDDGVGDNADAFPSDPSETADTDGDGIETTRTRSLAIHPRQLILMEMA